MLELGCGYGRVLDRICAAGPVAFGIDTSLASLEMAREILGISDHVHLAQMDASDMGFHDSSFDAVICIQNGISAFGVDQCRLIVESVRVTRPGGLAIFSSYSESFWPERLRWFELQAEEGLIGAIDYARTGNGVIVCTDGFRATTVGPHDFASLTQRLNLEARIFEVDDSCVFCEILVR